MFRPRGPPLSTDCMICGAKMGLTIVEPGHHRTVYTYRCPSRHLQELAIACPDLPGIPTRRNILRSGGLGWDVRR